MSEPVLFVDSGIGGIPYLLAAQQRMPDRAFAYLADAARFPYGNMPARAVEERVVEIVGVAIEMLQPSVCVVACNTASVVALAALRERYGIPFVGVVPAVKPAATVAADAPFAVLATDRTVSDPYVAGLIRDFAPGADVHLLPAGGLVEAIEEDIDGLDAATVSAALGPAVDHLERHQIRHVVLGCTHFVHVRQQIEAILGPDAVLIDSVEGVTRQIERVCADLPEVGAPEPVTLYSTGEPTASYGSIARRHRLHLSEGYAGNRSYR